MKPFGAIPVGYAAIDGELAIGGYPVSALIAEAGDTPLFVYDLGLIKSRIGALRAAMPPTLAIHYAVKANPFPPLVKAIAALIDGLDVASGGEMDLALANGGLPAHISFAGPGKRDRELEAAIRAGVTLNLESESEARRALVIAERIGHTPKLAVRVNPDFDLRGSGMKMGGGAKPFGVDTEQVPALVRLMLAAGADWRGFHIYAGSQALDALAVIDAQAQTVALAARLAEEIGTCPPTLNLGGGYGIPYFANERPLDLTAVGGALTTTLAERPAVLQGTRFCIELGRHLVGEAGVYLTRIIDRKTSHGEVFLVTDGGLHHQLAASGNFGTVVRRNYPVAIANRFEESPEEVVSIVGCLCTPLDRLSDQVMLPRADVGDVVALFMAGAYGATASPAGFLGHLPALERVVGG